MVILRIIDRLNVGGPARHVTWLTAGLNDDEWQTTLVAGTVPKEEGDMSGFAQARGVEPLRIPQMSRALTPLDAFVLWKLVRLMFRLKPQIVHTHKAKAGAVGRAAAWIYRWGTWSALRLRPRPCRVVHTYHGHIFHSYYGPAMTALFLGIERFLGRWGTDRIVVLSEQQRREIGERFGVGRAEQYRIVPLGIDFSELDRSADLNALPLPRKHRGPRVGIVGRLCEVKNHALFLDAVAILARRGVEAEFWIVGDGHLRAPLEAQARALGVEDRVTFTGFREDLGAIYRQLDLVALTSLNEGTPLTLIEAMAMGCPVVSTEAGGVPDLLGDEHESLPFGLRRDHGLTVPRADAEPFAEALAYLLDRPGLRGDMGARARDFARRRFGKDRLLDDIKSLYQEALAAGAKNAG